MIRRLKRLSTQLKHVRWAVWLSLPVMLFTGTGVSSAITQNDLYTEGINYFDLNVSQCATAGTAKSTTGSIVPAGQNSGTWNSGLTGPYTFEQFMIETLKDIAKKEGTDPANAVTQQHVIALLALAWGEGGARTNNDFWNPFNTGINAPDLLATGHAGNGVQAFKSFDAGVEATARVMTGPYQGRLGVTLINPTSSATDFLNSWLDFPAHSPYPVGHYPWAEASDPSSQYYEPNYKQVRLDLINQVTKNYASMASTIMRATSSDSSDKHDTSKLEYKTATSTVSTNGGTCGTSGAGGGFFGVAVAYAWPTYRHAPYCLMTSTYRTAVTKALSRINSGQNDYVGGGSNSLPGDTSDCGVGGKAGIDCGGFVTRVFRDSGVDPKYNANTSNVEGQYAYLASHPNLYTPVHGVQKTGDLHPGDIYIEHSKGHTYIFMGNKGYPGYDAVSASFSNSGLSWRTPMASHADDIQSAYWFRPTFPLEAATTTATGTGAVTGGTPSPTSITNP